MAHFQQGADDRSEPFFQQETGAKPISKTALKKATALAKRNAASNNASLPELGFPGEDSLSMTFLLQVVAKFEEAVSEISAEMQEWGEEEEDSDEEEGEDNEEEEDQGGQDDESEGASEDGNDAKCGEDNRWEEKPSGGDTANSTCTRKDQELATNKKHDNLENALQNLLKDAVYRGAFMVRGDSGEMVRVDCRNEAEQLYIHKNRHVAEVGWGSGSRSPRRSRRSRSSRLCTVYLPTFIGEHGEMAMRYWVLLKGPIVSLLFSPLHPLLQSWTIFDV